MLFFHIDVLHTIYFTSVSFSNDFFFFNDVNFLRCVGCSHVRVAEFTYRQERFILQLCEDVEFSCFWWYVDVLCKEVIFIPSGSVTDIEYFPVGWILWYPYLNQSKCRLHP